MSYKSSVSGDLLPTDSGKGEAGLVEQQQEVLPAQAATELKLWQAIKKWRRVTLYCVGMTSAVLMYGFDTVIVGTTSSMPSFQQDFGIFHEGKWILPSLWLALWNVSSPAASMIGAILGGYFQDWFGRRKSFAVGSILTAAGVAVLYVSNVSDSIHTRRIVFLVGKAFQGGAIGMIMTTTQTYMSEILPPVLRGPILAFFPTFTLLGQLIGAGVIFACLEKANGYVICFAVQWPFSAVPLILSFIVPESPVYLIRNNEVDKAFKSQSLLDPLGVDTKETVRLLQEHIARERLVNERATYMDCFRGTNTRRSFIIVFAALLPQIFGLTILAKASYFVQVAGMKHQMSLLILIFGIIAGFFANIAGIWLVSRYERRFLSLCSLVALVLLWFAMGISGIWSGKATMWYTAASLIAIVVAAGLGVWPCSYAISAETSTLNLRSKAQGIAWLTAGASTALFGFVTPYIFNTDQGDMGPKTGFVYAAICLIGLVVMFFYVPDMKGRTAAQIDQMFEQKLNARKFRKWTPDE